MLRLDDQLIIIAEVGSVHDGSFGNAIKLIDLAKKVGANAVKFQLHISEFETIKNAPNPNYFTGEDRYSYFNRTSFSIDQWKKLRSYAKKKKILFGVSPFSEEALEILLQINIDFIKIASGEVTNSPLIIKSLKSGKTVLISTGMSDKKELITQLKKVNIYNFKENVCVMQCTSEYPCPLKNVGLEFISFIKDKLKLNVGFSDHTLGYSASIGAIYYGANIFEKHLTFSKNMYGSDAKNSMEPNEFKEYVDLLKESYFLKNNSNEKKMTPHLINMKKIFQKSIVAKININKNDIVNESFFTFKKPGTGMAPNELKNLINMKAKHFIHKDSLIKIGMFKKK